MQPKVICQKYQSIYVMNKEKILNYILVNGIDKYNKQIIYHEQFIFTLGT